MRINICCLLKVSCSQYISTFFLSVATAKASVERLCERRKKSTANFSAFLIVSDCLIYIVIGSETILQTEQTFSLLASSFFFQLKNIQSAHSLEMVCCAVSRRRERMARKWPEITFNMAHVEIDCVCFFVDRTSRARKLHTQAGKTCEREFFYVIRKFEKHA